MRAPGRERERERECECERKRKRKRNRFGVGDAGLPGVTRFWGPGGAGVVHEFLYDKDGNVVGTDQPQVLSGATRGGSELSDCNTLAGFTHGAFSSVVELFGSRRPTG